MAAWVENRKQVMENVKENEKKFDRMEKNSFYRDGAQKNKKKIEK